jgi:Type II CAAX prenyl endopeptidase Rce1-like
MRKIIGYFRTHFKADFNPALYFIVALIIAFGLYLNYTYHIESGYLNHNIGKLKTFFQFFLVYALPYYLVSLVVAYFNDNWSFLSKREYWLKSLFFLTLLTFNASTNFHYKWIFKTVDPQVRYFVIKVFLNLGSAMIFFLPLLVFWIFVDRSKVNGLYGLARKGFIPLPYFGLIALMLPLIIYASFQPDFLATYPTYRSGGSAELYLGIPMWLSTGVYQFFYAFDFVFVELLFRGALVIGLSRVMGKDAILPMVATYCFLHFGKPLGEAVSSVFGGYILGVIAYYGKNIWGGAIVHMGIALSMEWAAIIQTGGLK